MFRKTKLYYDVFSHAWGDISLHQISLHITSKQENWTKIWKSASASSSFSQENIQWIETWQPGLILRYIVNISKVYCGLIPSPVIPSPSPSLKSSFWLLFVYQRSCTRNIIALLSTFMTNDSKLTSVGVLLREKRRFKRLLRQKRQLWQLRFTKLLHAA